LKFLLRLETETKRKEEDTQRDAKTESHRELGRENEADKTGGDRQRPRGTKTRHRN
jgi:hypothetical protein